MRHKRQADIITDKDLDFPIHILGAGGIGSWVVLTLAKMGCENLIVYDDDKVEDHNIASQFFKEDQLRLNKVDALYDNVLEQTGIQITPIINIKEEETITDKLIIITIDSMAERIRLGKIYEKRNIDIIDGRMGGLAFEIYNTTAKEYLSTTIAPADVDHEPCTRRSISFNCLVIAGLIANQVKQYAKKDFKSRGELMFDFNSQTLIKDKICTKMAT